MSERSEPIARAPPEPTVHLTLAEAAERLGITPNAVRMRVHRGTLASIRVNECTFVLWPQPAQPHARRTHDARDERSVDRDVLIEALQSEVTYLRSALDAEREARYRADHLVARLMDRLPAIAAGLEEALQDAHTATLRDETATAAPESLLVRLRRWWTS